MIQQKGFLSILTLVLITVLAGLGLVAANLFYTSSLSGSEHYQADAALYLAESGLEHSKHKILEQTVANRNACLNYSTGVQTLGAGVYSATGSSSLNYVSSPTALSAAITATATSIPVASTSNYQAAGRIMIDGEIIQYNSVSATSFNNVTRGFDSTVASAHPIGALAGQYQCTISASGAIPNLTAPRAVRKIQASLQLQTGWAVGDGSSSTQSISQWNYPTETTWNTISTSGLPSASLLSISMLSYAEGWTVGSNGLVLYWNGNAFNRVILPNNYSGTLYQVFCAAHNACYIVGDGASIFNWNGSSWSKATIANLSNTNINLNGVHCDSSSDCWAVGNPNNTGNNNNGYGGWYGYSDNGWQPFSDWYSQGWGGWAGWGNWGQTAGYGRWGGYGNSYFTSNIFMHWNGSSWTAYNQTLSSNGFNDVYCNNSANCWAVGNNATFAELTVGTAWINYVTSLPNVEYNALYCNSASDCWVVGNVYNTTTVIGHWNGLSWSLLNSGISAALDLNGIQCYKTDDCWAVGNYDSNNNPAWVHWDGNTWTIVNSASIGGGKAINALSLIGANAEPVGNWAEVFA